MNPFREKTEYALVKGLIVCLKPLPTKIITSAFRLFGDLFFLLGFRRRNLTLKNLAIAFPEKSRKERVRIARRAFLNMAEFTGDSFLLMAGKLSPEEILSMVDDAQLEKYKTMRNASGKGALHITGHLGNWELMAQYGALQGLESHVVARKGSNQLIDDRIVTPLRTRYGNKVFYKENAMINTVKALKRNEAVSFLIDQRIGPKEGVPVQFFGQSVLAVASCAALQIRFDPLVIPVFLMKTSRRRYKLIIGDAIQWNDDGSPQEEQIQKLTQHYQRVIEETIRQYPDQWFWMHNRWRL
ncbi:MAG: lysophospholipid acyltransferase family protein [Kiritimatiellaceae bacterium]|nr:lysophospholipid acyltransferase family protein [Kiritimatiellaceae bacterium]